MMIFPLSWPGKLVLILIAITIGLIYWLMADPGRFGRLRRGEKEWWKKRKDAKKDGEKDESIKK